MRQMLAALLALGLLSGAPLEANSPVKWDEAAVLCEVAACMPDTDMLARDLEALTAAPRPVGSAGEEAAARYVCGRLRGMGYETSVQPYTSVDGQAKRRRGIPPPFRVLCRIIAAPSRHTFL